MYEHEIYILCGKSTKQRTWWRSQKNQVAYDLSSWMLDFAIRAGVGILLLVVGSVIVGGVKKAVRGKSEDEMI